MKRSLDPSAVLLTKRPTYKGNAQSLNGTKLPHHNVRNSVCSDLLFRSMMSGEEEEEREQTILIRRSSLQAGFISRVKIRAAALENSE